MTDALRRLPANLGAGGSEDPLRRVRTAAASDGSLADMLQTNRKRSACLSIFATTAARWLQASLLIAETQNHPLHPRSQT